MDDSLGGNQLSIEIYQGLSATPRLDPLGLLNHAEIRSFTKTYPGGLYVACTIFVPCPITTGIIWQGFDRLVLRNGLAVAWEGQIANIDYTVEGGADQGITIEAIGTWGTVLGQYALDKRWADNRLDNGIWRWQDTDGGGKCRIERTSRLRFTPQGEEWINGEYAAVRYTMPTGQTVKRVTYDYDFSELAVERPKKIWLYDSGGLTYTDLTNAYDGDQGTSVTVTITTGDYIYVDVLEGTDYAVINVNMGGTVNANASVMTAEYPTEDSNGTITWTALTISDGTASGGATLAQDGDISFTRPDNIAETTVSSSRRAWVRLLVSANLTANIVILEVQLRKTQVWKLSLYNVGTAAEVVTVTATATGSTDHTLATPSQSVELRFVSLAKQTPPGNDSVYVEITNIVVYSETGSINLTEVATDIVGTVTNLNSATTHIGSNTFSLVPFFTTEPLAASRILEEAAGYGGASQEAWGCTLISSEFAGTPNGKPLLKVEAVPALSDYDYIVRADEENVVPPFGLMRDFVNIVNWVMVKYRDDANDRDIIITPDDESTLTDTTSSTTYGQRRIATPLDLGNAGETVAINFGRRFLAQNKNPKWIMSSPLTILDSIRTKTGGAVPASQIEPGKRVRIENFLQDLSSSSGAGLTFLITDTSHSDNGRQVSISAGQSNDLSVLLAQIAYKSKAGLQNTSPNDRNSLL